ncbi:MAG: hypothetical protein LJE70_00485 [Chromatiaceae bacterium]|nr:hypothetical protein [Chromatiaceae bacterium]
MPKKNNVLMHNGAQDPMGQAADPKSCADIGSSVASKREKDSVIVVRMIVTLKEATRSTLPVAKRISLLRDLHPKVKKVTARLPKPNVPISSFDTGDTAVLTLEQHLTCLMVQNLKLALDDLGQSKLAFSDRSTRLRWWLLRNSFRYLGRMIEYAIRWNKPYPSGIWQRLHELYRDVHTRANLANGFDDQRAEGRFDAETEYKRLLLLGIIGHEVPVADRSTRLFEALRSLAKESRLARAETYSGSFDLWVVEIAQDKPPHRSTGISQDFNGWIFKPAQNFLKGLKHSSVWYW